MTCYGRPGGRPALLQVRTVDCAVDRSSDPWGCACVHVSRSTRRSTDPMTVDRAVDQLTDLNSQFGTVDRAVDQLQPTVIIFENRSTGRSTVRGISGQNG